MFRSTLVLFLALAACGDNIHPPFPKSCEPGQAEAPRTVSLWLQDDPDLGADEAVQGCDMWEAKCLQCELSDDPKAAAQLVVSHDECVSQDDFSYVLAYSVFGGRVTINMECIRLLFAPDPDGHPSRKILAWVIGHELGHEAGMWWHVPELCFEDTVKSDFEKSLVRMGVCGKAVMNPYIDSSLEAITVFDKEAFDLRDTGQTTFPHLTAEEAPTGCVLTYRPAH